ncbi:MAG: AbrB/MazE/SpoVT family DNA-binding domain-containing protein [Candidatus Peribacteria bacterium]|nr:AbrB/MazE/SpoVT family DNA-binding domain-containing protein [Candidatus Peribacteria bacterium]
MSNLFAFFIKYYNITILINLTNLFMNYTLKLFNTGQVTLPKSWRDKYNTNNFLAIETQK